MSCPDAANNYFIGNTIYSKHVLRTKARVIRTLNCLCELSYPVNLVKSISSRCQTGVNVSFSITIDSGVLRSLLFWEAFFFIVSQR